MFSENFLKSRDYHLTPCEIYDGNRRSTRQALPVFHWRCGAVGNRLNCRRRPGADLDRKPDHWSPSGCRGGRYNWVAESYFSTEGRLT